MKVKKIIALVIAIVLFSAFATALGGTLYPDSIIVEIDGVKVEFPVADLADPDMGDQFVAWFVKAQETGVVAKVYLKIEVQGQAVPKVIELTVGAGVDDLVTQINDTTKFDFANDVLTDDLYVADSVVGGSLIITKDGGETKEKIENPGETPKPLTDADKALAAAKAKVKALNEAEYTEESWEVLDDALALPETSEKEIADKAAAIEDAITGLVEKEGPGPDPTVTQPAFGTPFYMNETTTGAPEYDGFGNYWLVFPYTVGNTDIVITGYSVTNGTNTATVEGLNFPKAKETSGFVYVDASDLGLADDNAAIPAGNYTATITYNIGTETGKTVSSNALVVAKALEVPAPAEPVYSVGVQTIYDTELNLHVLLDGVPQTGNFAIAFWDERDENWILFTSKNNVFILNKGVVPQAEEGNRYILIIDNDAVKADLTDYDGENIYDSEYYNKIGGLDGVYTGISKVYQP